jgi:hypothetical protein
MVDLLAEHFGENLNFKPFQRFAPQKMIRKWGVRCKGKVRGWGGDKVIR